MAVVMNIFVVLLLAQGGPPLLTDDPATPGDGRHELNVAFTVVKFRQATLYEAPLLDYNYGIGDRGQLKIEVPWLFKHEHPGTDESGLGNVLVGFKYRFFDQEQGLADLAFYPQTEFRTVPRSRRVGLVGEGFSLLLPIEIEHDFGPISVCVEAGYLWVEEEDDAWIWGVAFGRDVAEGVEFLGEIHGESGRSFDGGEIVWNLGARVKLSELNTLLFSAGRGIHGAPRLIGYLGLQFNF
jgi:hypothetical protein